jgi:chorismate dehydratase
VKKIRISAVSYTNTKPFLYGIQNTPIFDKIDLSLDIPADCAQKLIDDKVDIGLIPVASILNLHQWNIISAYCIGANGPVNSVFVFSNCAIADVKTMQFDPQSRTSNNLARVLMKNFWKVQPKPVIGAADYAASTDPYTAFVQIGDRTFGKKSQFEFAYDLSEEWQRFTGLPFVFAAWIANKTIPQDFVDEFNISLKYGLDHRQELLMRIPQRPDFDLEDYLMHKLDFDLTADKKKALYLFLDYINKL